MLHPARSGSGYMVRILRMVSLEHKIENYNVHHKATASNLLYIAAQQANSY